MKKYTNREGILHDKKEVIQETKKELDDLKAEIEEHKNCIDFQVYMDDMKTKDAIIKDLENQIEDMRKQKKRMVHELAETKETLEHRDELIVKLYDLIRNEDHGIVDTLAIIKCVIDAECDQDQTLTDTVIVNMFRKGLFN